VAESRRKTHGFKCRCEDWARDPELRRRCACLHHGAILKRSTEYKVVARDQRNTNGELASDFHRRLQLAVSHITSNRWLCDAATNGGGFANQRCEVCRPKPTHLAVVLAAIKDATRR